VTKNDAADPSAGDPTVSLRELAVARSLNSARTRAENRVQRFLDGAREVMSENTEFTVQDVVERSGQSLRSFYQYFGGKNELLLALFEESVHAAAEFLQERIAEEDGALDRLHRFVVEYHGLCRPAAKGAASRTGPAPVIVDFAQQLLTAQPTQAALAFVPIVSLFGDILDDAAAAGEIRGDLRGGPIAGVVLEMIMFNAFSATIAGSPVQGDRSDAEELWDLILHGIGAG